MSKTIRSKKLKKKYFKEERRHDEAYEKENKRHEKKHIKEIKEAETCGKKKK